MSSTIDTPAKRAKLTARRNPYWQGVAGGRGGVSIGYRRAKAGGGWIAKLVLDGRRIEERIGAADDDGAPAGALPFRAAVAVALDWSGRQHAALEARKTAGAPTKAPTVRSAVDAYVTRLTARNALSGRITRGRLANYVLADRKFADTTLAKVRASTIEAWRERLPVSVDGKTDGTMSHSTLNRLLTDLRAALNATADRQRRELPAHLPAEIRIGTRPVSVEAVARKQILTDEDVRGLIAAAFQVDPDFGNLVLLAAATGARYSQITKAMVGDLQPAAARIMMPGSKKGRAARARPRVALPLAAEVVERLEAATSGRDFAAPLLMKWAFKRDDGIGWERDKRRPWGPAYEIAKPWAATVAKAGVAADTVFYAFRHSSIVRGLRANLPVRLVAALHDTSIAMIEDHYAAFIVDATEDLSRRVAFSL